MRELVQAVFKTGSSSIASTILSIVSSKIMAVVVGPFGVGIYSLIQQLTSTASIVGSVGGSNVALTQGIASRKGKDRDDFTVTSFWILAIGGTISSLSLVLFAPWIAPFVFGADDTFGVSLVRWTALPVALLVMLTYLVGVLNGHLAIGKIAAIQLVGAGMNALLSYPISLIAGTGYYMAFVVMMTATLSLQMIVAIVEAHRDRYLRPITANGLRFRLTKAAARPYFAVAGTMMVTSVVASVGLLLVRALIVQYRGVADAGIFNVAWVICMSYPLVILSSFGTYYLPKLSQTSEANSRCRLMRDVFRLTTLLIVPVELMVIVLKPAIVDILYSQEFYDTLVILRWMFIGVYLKAASWVFAMPMFAYADMRTHFWTGTLWYVGFVSLSAASLAAGTMEIIGVGFLAIYGIYLIFTLHYSSSRHGFSFDHKSSLTWVAGLGLIVLASATTWSDTRVHWLYAGAWLVIAVCFSILATTSNERRNLVRAIPWSRHR